MSDRVSTLPSFDPDKFQRGQKHSLDLPLDAWVSGAKLPVLLVRGHRPGPTLVATAGVHGDEYEGVRAIFEHIVPSTPMK